MKQLLSFCLAIASVYGGAETSVPLMPPRVATRESRAYEMPPPAAQTRTALKKESKRNSSATGIGFELGVIGRPNSTQNDLAGFQLFGGARTFARFEIFDDVFLVPSLGYFLKREAQGSASVSQHLFELGTSAFYGLWVGRKSRLLLGATVKGEYAMTSVGAANTNGSTAGAFRWRGGPAMGLAMGLSTEWSFVVDFEGTVSSDRNPKFQPGVAAGLIYFLP